LSLLSQFAQDGNTSKVARGFKSKMEDYYEEYIHSVAGDIPSVKFKSFSSIFPDEDYNSRFTRLSETITALEIPPQFTSIIEMDTHLFGLIYAVVFEDKVIDVNRKDDLRGAIDAQIAAFRTDDAHKKAPSALKYLKARIDASITIYNNYLNA
jgi:hypothetical protein